MVEDRCTVLVKKTNDAVLAFVTDAVKEQVESLGAKFLAPEDLAEGEGGYAQELTEQQKQRQQAQLMPATAERYGVSDRNNPQQNVRGGANYLKDLLIMFEFDLKLAIAAYNAGENAVIRSGNKIPNYKETRNYVAKVLKFYRQNRFGNS